MKLTFEDEFGELNEADKSEILAVVETTKEEFESTGGVSPTFILGYPDGEIELTKAGFENQQEKEAVIGTIKKRIKDKGANSLMLVLESYTIPTEHMDDFASNRDKYPTISSHPKAIDIIMFSFDNEHGTWTAVVEVNCSTSKFLSNEVNFMSVDQQSGLVTGFIPRKPRSGTRQ